jgi:virginiamycin B lyase
MTITEYPLPNADSRPRRIAIAADDTVYYTDYARGMLGRLNPQTRKVEEFPSPGGAESQPYAITVAPNGVVWYCETGNDTKNMLVRFDPATAAMRAWPIPSGGGTVRHMVAAGNGDLWLAESGVGKIARVQVR